MTRLKQIMIIGLALLLLLTSGCTNNEANLIEDEIIPINPLWTAQLDGLMQCSDYTATDLYIMTTKNTLYRMDLSNGKILSQIPLEASDRFYWQLDVHENYVVATSDVLVDVFDAKSGKRKYVYNPDGTTMIAEIGSVFSNDEIVICYNATGERVDAFDPDSGKVVWTISGEPFYVLYDHDGRLFNRSKIQNCFYELDFRTGAEIGRYVFEKVEWPDNTTPSEMNVDVSGIEDNLIANWIYKEIAPYNLLSNGKFSNVFSGVLHIYNTDHKFEWKGKLERPIEYTNEYKNLVLAIRRDEISVIDSESYKRVFHDQGKPDHEWTYEFMDRYLLINEGNGFVRNYDLDQLIKGN